MKLITLRNGAISIFNMHWNEFKAKLELTYLITRRRLRERFINHSYKLDHDIENKKCCHNKRESKEKQFGKNRKKETWQQPLTAEVLRAMVKSDRWKSSRRKTKESYRQEKISKSLIYHSSRLGSWSQPYEPEQRRSIKYSTCKNRCQKKRKNQIDVARESLMKWQSK